MGQISLWIVWIMTALPRDVHDYKAGVFLCKKNKRAEAQGELTHSHPVI